MAHFLGVNPVFPEKIVTESVVAIYMIVRLQTFTGPCYRPDARHKLELFHFLPGRNFS